LLEEIKPIQKAPWLMLGDINEAMWQHEHWSRRKMNEKQMYDFRNALSLCNLHDLGFNGLPWTYDNNQKGEKMSESDWTEWLLFLIGQTCSLIIMFATWLVPDLTTAQS
jgi:hypothetical protein